MCSLNVLHHSAHKLHMQSYSTYFMLMMLCTVMLLMYMLAHLRSMESSLLLLWELHIFQIACFCLMTLLDAFQLWIGVYCNVVTLDIYCFSLEWELSHKSYFCSGMPYLLRESLLYHNMYNLVHEAESKSHLASQIDS